MKIEQFILESLGHASYLLASESSGEAIVVDPRRDVDPYLDAERRYGVRIVGVLDTHQHNDYVSGIVELSRRTGAQMLASAEANVGYDNRAVKDGEELALGEMRLRVVHTPGHTPEHVSLLVFDGADEPAMLISGGALLVGDLARPDLLGGPEEKRDAARTFCRTLQDKILPLPDHVLVYPTHVAGSLCGGNIGSRYSTTVGYERRTNPVLSAVAARDVFVEECIRMDDLPAVPPYWRRMRGLNQRGPEPVGVIPPPPALQVDAFARRMQDGAVVLDARSPEAFAGTHIPGALNVGLSTSFPTWAGTIVPDDRDIVLVLHEPSDLTEVVWSLLRIGYRVPAGWLAGGISSWRTSAREIGFVPHVQVRDLAARRGDYVVLDVRQPGEWADGHVDGALFVTGAEVPERLAEIPDGKPVAIMCGSGYRSSVIASLLKHHGRSDVVNILGGMSAWRSAGLPTTN
ncbi:MAG TPA: MBL fold metallo-hydrolase [Actinomycetota bacterium]